MTKTVIVTKHEIIICNKIFFLFSCFFFPQRKVINSRFTNVRRFFNPSFFWEYQKFKVDFMAKNTFFKWCKVNGIKWLELKFFYILFQESLHSIFKSLLGRFKRKTLTEIYILNAMLCDVQRQLFPFIN